MDSHSTREAQVFSSRHLREVHIAREVSFSFLSLCLLFRSHISRKCLNKTLNASSNFDPSQT